MEGMTALDALLHARDRVSGGEWVPTSKLKSLLGLILTSCETLDVTPLEKVKALDYVREAIGMEDLDALEAWALSPQRVPPHLLDALNAAITRMVGERLDS